MNLRSSAEVGIVYDRTFTAKSRSGGTMLESATRSVPRIRWLALSAALLVSACDPLSLADLFKSEHTGTSILMLLDADDHDLTVGSEVQGALSASDYVGVDGAYMDAWEIDGKEGRSVTIDMTSDDFDSYLYVVGPGLAETLRDDDGGGACHARITFTFLESGEYHVIASSTSSGQTGGYRLRVSDEVPPRVPISCGGVDGYSLSELPREGGDLVMGDAVTGRLTGAEPSIADDRPVQAWALRGEAGERVTIQLASDDFDSYLYFFGPGMTETMTDDDGGVGLNSEITATLAETGTYVIGAAALSSGATGAYTLTVSAPIDLTALPTDGRRLRRGSVDGRLTATDPTFEGKPVQAWAFEARAGDVVTIEQLSEDVDSYLRVVGPGVDLSNDDGGDGLDSRLDVTFPESATYRVIASSLGGDTGAYTLRVR